MPAALENSETLQKKVHQSEERANDSSASLSAATLSPLSKAENYPWAAVEK